MAIHVLRSTEQTISPGVLDPGRPPALTIDAENSFAIMQLVARADTLATARDVVVNSVMLMVGPDAAPAVLGAARVRQTVVQTFGGPAVSWSVGADRHHYGTTDGT